MKKSLKGLIAVSAAVMTTGAFASNMENPLYMPKAHEVYLKTGAAVMYKITDHTPALKKRDLDGKEEFPVWRFTGDLGYGITDRLALIGRFGYTHDDDIDRKGMHRGRIGAIYRLLEEQSAPLVLDLYSEAFLSGVSPMKGTYTANGFKFDNYSNGRYGIIVGTRFGKTWDKFTLAAHVEYLQTFGNHNNKIELDPALKPLENKLPAHTLTNTARNMNMQDFGFPDEISVDLKGTHETVAGFDANYQMNETWSFGAGFEYVEHSDNGVKSIHSKLGDESVTLSSLLPAPLGGMTISTSDIEKSLLEQTKNMKDGWDEYVLKANVGYQISDATQLVFFAEYTLDDSHRGSQNGTDVKAEAGFRFNALF